VLSHIGLFFVVGATIGSRAVGRSDAEGVQEKGEEENVRVWAVGSKRGLWVIVNHTFYPCATHSPKDLDHSCTDDEFLYSVSFSELPSIPLF
jgi:hypothetical protein